MKRLKHLLPACLTTLALMAACTATSAQTVYRCGNSYSQTPCANAVVVQTDDPRSEAQRAQAKEALAQDMQLAKDLETTRHKEETLAFQREQAQRAAQARIAAAQARAEAKKEREAKPHKKPATPRTAKVQEDGVFTATVGNETPKKSKTGKSAP